MDDDLLLLASSQIYNVNTMCSPGFGTVIPSLIICANRRGLNNTAGVGTMPKYWPLTSLIYSSCSLRKQNPDLGKRPTPILKEGIVTDPGNYRIILVSGTLNTLHANLLRSLIQDLCGQHSEIPDTQFAFHPGCITLHILFILRHMWDAAQEVQREL